MSKKRICIFGSTGSIGTQTLDICEKLSDRFQVVGLSCNANKLQLERQARHFGVSHTRVGSDDLVSLIDECEADIVVNALVGAAGLRVSHEALLRNVRLALANKESLVVGGDILVPLVKKTGQLMPIDSEHGAIFQCLIGEKASDISKLLITASGGPFYEMKRGDLCNVDAKSALRHPTWSMGEKITIDSATLMNKGLEVIEAHHLFGIDYDDIEVVVQRESVIHSMVEFIDGSVKAHMGTTDMRIPIQYALTYPDREMSPVTPIDFREIGSLTFGSVDTDAFRCLEIAYEVGRSGGILPCAMNAANEVANQNFRENRCSFLDIASCIDFVISETSNESANDIEQLLQVDRRSRILASEFLRKQV